MRLAVFSDVHGNPFACRAVLRAIAAEGPFDQVIAAGDLSLGGSDPAGCIDMIRAAGVQAVYGNTDQYLYAPHLQPGDELHLKKWDQILEDVNWALPILGSQRVDWLASLPFEIRIHPENSQAADLLIVHANPQDIEMMILPPPAEQIELFDQVRQPDDDPELVRALADLDAAVLAFGHLHYTCERFWQGKRLVNVASVSMPAYNPDPSARYSLFEWDGKSWQIQHRQAYYDYAQEIKALRRSGMPGREYSIRTFPGSTSIS